MKLKEFAKQVGLSPTTVSRALSGYPEVSETTRARVEEAAARPGYSPNVNAVRLHLMNLRTKGLVEKVKADQWRPKPQKLTSTTAFDPIGGEQGRWQTVAEAVVDGVFN